MRIINLSQKYWRNFKKCLKDIFPGRREKYPNQSVSNLIPPIPVPLLLVWAPFPTFPSANKQFLALFGHKCFSQKCFQYIHTFENLKDVFKILTLLTTIDTQIFGFKIVNRKASTKICSLASHLFFKNFTTGKSPAEVGRSCKFGAPPPF